MYSPNFGCRKWRVGHSLQRFFTEYITEANLVSKVTPSQQLALSRTPGWATVTCSITQYSASERACNACLYVSALMARDSCCCCCCTHSGLRRVFLRVIRGSFPGSRVKTVSGPIGHESVPKIIINDTVDLVFKTAISYLIGLISNHNSVRVLFDKTASVYFI